MNCLYPALAFLAVAFLSTGCGSSQTAHNTAEILQDGHIIQRIDLEKETGSRTVTLSYRGHTNTILIENRAIRIRSADCPDQLCVRMGTLQTAGPPIVCLPNRLVIRYAEQP